MRFRVNADIKHNMLVVCAFSSSDRNEMLVKAFFTEYSLICRQLDRKNGMIICLLRTLIGILISSTYCFL